MQEGPKTNRGEQEVAVKGAEEVHCLLPNRIEVGGPPIGHCQDSLLVVVGRSRLQTDREVYFARA